jgi:hypothetical protein
LSIAATAAAATAAGPPLPSPPPPWSTHRCPLPKKEATAAAPQCTNGSTNVKMFTSPDNLDLFNLSTVFEVCDDDRGNLAITKLLVKKICTFFAIYILQNDMFFIFWEVMKRNGQKLEKLLTSNKAN